MTKFTKLLLLSMLVCLTSIGSIFAQEAIQDAPNPLNMESGKHTYLVGDDGISFYDDGGKDAVYSENFDGTVTFKPKDPSKKILIDFSKIDLFWSDYAHGVGNTSDLNIYDGSSALTASKLFVKDLKKAAVLSEAKDGSLTVKFSCKSNPTWGSGPYQGWEAVVKQVAIDVPMEIVKVTTDQKNLNNKANIGDRNVQVMRINLQTKGYASINLNKIVFSTSLPFFSTARLSVGRGTDDFKDAKEIKQINIADKKEIVFDLSDVKLSMGNNYLFLSVDVSENATDKAKATFDLTDFKAGNETYEKISQAGNIEKSNAREFQINRTIMLDLGKREFSLNNLGVNIQSQTPAGSSYKYDSSKGDRILTLEATESEMVPELVFSKIKISFPSYSPEAPFLKVYDGKGENGTLLVNINNSNDQEAYVGKIIRSTGKFLTILFHTDGENAGFGDGIEASARLYKPQVMTPDSASITPITLDIVAPGTKDAKLIGIDAVTQGNITRIGLDKVVLSLNGSAKYLEKIKLYQSNNKYEFADEDLVAEKTIQEGAEDITFSGADFDNLDQLREYNNYFCVTADLRADAPCDGQVLVGLKELQADQKNFRIDHPTPEKGREVKNIFLQPKNGTAEKVVTSDLYYYDDGGISGKASEGESTVTFKPGKPGEKVHFHILSFAYNYNARFKVYNGLEAKGSPIFEGKTIKSDDPFDITSTSEDGALTVHFNCSTTYCEGWEIAVSSIIPRDRKITKVVSETSVAANDEGVTKGGTIGLLKIAANVEGEKGAAKLGKMTFAVSDNIASAKIYFSGKSDKFSASDEVASAMVENGKCVLDVSSKEIELSRPHYFWFVAQIASNAKPDEVISAKLESIDPAIEDFTSTAGESKVVKGISGDILVGASGNAKFKKIQEAFEYLEKGIDGPVNIVLEDGTYDIKDITIKEVKGASSENTITLESKSKDRTKAIIRCAAKYGAENAVIIKGIDNLTLRNLTIDGGDTEYKSIVLISDGANYVTIDSCTITAKKSTGFRPGTRLIKMESKDVPQNNNNFTLTNSKLEGGYIGLELASCLGVAKPAASGATITNNIFTDAGSKLVYINRYANFKFNNNQFLFEKDGGGKVTCMDMNRGLGKSEICANMVSVKNSSKQIDAFDFRGFNVPDENRDKDAHLLMANNTIHLENVEGQSTAVKFGDRTLSTNVDFVYNTIVIDGEDASNSKAIFITPGSKTQNIKIANNIIQNKANGFVYRMQGKKDATFDPSVTFHNNALFASDADKFAETINEDLNYETWVEKSGEKDSKVAEVKFASKKLYLPRNKAEVAFALPMEEVKTDIIGKTRNAEHPSVGAYEAEYDIPDTAPAISVFKADNIKGNSADLVVTSDQLATLYYRIQEKDDEAPTTEKIKEIGMSAPLAPKENLIPIKNLDIDTEYVVYAVAVGINDLETQLEPLHFGTASNPILPSNFDDPLKIDHFEGGFNSGSNKFVGFEIVKDPNGTEWDTNQVAKMTGNEATIYVTNTKKAIEQPGFMMMNEKSVTITAIREDNLKGETTEDTMKVEPSEDEFYYIHTAELGNVRALKIVSEGKVYIDDYNGSPRPIVLTVKDGGAVKGQKTTVSVSVSGGLAPYKYEWSNGGKTAQNEVTVNKTEKITVTVTDALGTKASTFAYVIAVDGEDQFKTATFEGLEIPEAKFVNNTRFVSEQYLFNNSYNPAYGSWSGFAYTNSKDSTFTNYSNGTDQYNVVAKGGYKSDNYAVGYYSSFTGAATINVAAGDMGTQVKGTMLALTSWTYSFFVNGDPGQKQDPVKEGDFFVVTFTGDNGKTVTDSLVNYTGGKEIIEKNWKWVDLSKLGKVKTIAISTKGSRSNNYGDVVPSYFAIDNFNCDKPKNVSAKVPFSSQVRAYLADGKIFVKDADGYTIKLHTMDGSLVNEFVAGSDDEVRDANLPEGTYIMVAHKGTEVVRQKLIMR